MVNNVVNILRIHTSVSGPHVCMNIRSVFNVTLNVTVQGLAVSIADYVRSNLAVTLKQAHHGNLARPASADIATVANVPVHVASKTADVCLIDFDMAFKLFCERSSLHSKTDAMLHKPSRLLRDANRSGNLITANAVFAIGDHPDGHQPLIQAKRRVFKDGSDLDAKLSALVRALALPFALFGEERHIGTSACWADNAVGPATGNQVSKAIIRIREVDDCLLKCFGCFRFHSEERLTPWT